jgi:hypothetical protein
MTKLYQDEFLFDKNVLLKKEHKLQSLLNRAESCYNLTYESFLTGKKPVSPNLP